MLTRRRPARLNLASQAGLAGMLDQPRYEVLPLSGIEDLVAQHVPDTVPLTVTASVRQGIHATVDVATRLAAQGRHVVPHISARLIADDAELKEIIGSLSSAGVTEIFVVGGDAESPVGEFSGTVDLLNAMEWIGHDFCIGVAGYPETHPKIADDVTVRALWDKQPYASYIVSQMCFDSRQVGAWVHSVRDRGITLPIYIGIAGPAKTSHLLRVSARIGVGQSARVLRHHGSGLLRIAQPGTWRPDSLLRNLAPLFADPEHHLAGLHMYTFNAVQAAEEWRQSLLEHLQ